MSDFIKMASEFFYLIINYIRDLIDGITTMLNSLTFISEGLSVSQYIFPTFIGSIMVTCVTLLIVLRIIGR